MEQANANGSAVIKQRIHRSEEEILKLLDEQEKSGFSVKEFCEVSDINEATFYSWVKKYRKIEDQEKGFTTIEIVPTKETKPSLFAEVNGVRLFKEVSADNKKLFINQNTGN